MKFEFTPAYKHTIAQGLMGEKIALARQLSNPCRLCPRECRVNRMEGEIGYCKAKNVVRISSIGPHFGEEPPLVGRYGSGTIFFSYCNLKCIFCQNYDISHHSIGNDVSIQELAEAMLYLQSIGCHNINLVTPTHYLPQIVEAIFIASENGLNLPIVYNCGGYESLEAIEILEGIVDIYMPDFKFSDDKISKELANAPNYFEKAKKAIKEMHRQVGILKMNKDGIAYRGLLIRHLVMPANKNGSEEVLKFIAHELSVDSYVNIMAQYWPAYLAREIPEINRRITDKEYANSIAIARKYGLHRGFYGFYC